MLILRDPRIRSEVTEEVGRFFLEWPVICVLSMVPRVITIGFFLLIEVEIDEEIPSVHFRIGMESGVAGACQRSDKARLIPVLPLKGISRTTEYRYGIVGNIADDDFHKD